MWVFTDRGFVSAVEYNAKKDKTTPMSRRQLRRLGRNPVLCRARVKNDLEQIRPFFSALEIQDDKSADYQFRAFVPRRAFVAWLADAGEKIDYDSHFKEVAAKRSSGSTQRHTAMMGVWSAMEKLQPNPAYGHAWSSYGGDSALCKARYVDENSKSGEWCNYKDGHAGKHEFEVKRGLPIGSEFSSIKSTVAGKPPVTKAKTTWPPYGGSTTSQPTTSQPKLFGCSRHFRHEFRNNRWYGSYESGSEVWFPCDGFALGVSGLGTVLGPPASPAPALGSTLATALDSLPDTPDDEEVKPRAPGAADCDSLPNMIRAMQTVSLGQIPVDPATPEVCYELWAYAESLHGEHVQLEVKDLAGVLVDLIDDPALVAFHDQYLAALDDLGYEVVDVTDDRDTPESPSRLTDVPGMNGQDAAGDLPADETAVAVDKEVSK